VPRHELRLRCQRPAARTAYILPLLGRKVTKVLTQADIARFQADVAAGKTAADIKTGKRGRAIVEGGKGTAARSLAVLGAMLQFGVGHGILPINPAKGVKLLHGEKKERFLSEVEIARLADTLTVMEAEGLNKNVMAAIRLLLLTGCRKSEILALRWEHVDLERHCLRLPDRGAKVVPLAAAALEILAGLPRASARRRLKWANFMPTSPRQPSCRLNRRSPPCKARSKRLFGSARWVCSRPLPNH
jgi:integrase